MKKVISGVLVAILLAVTIGVPVSRHTCYVFDRSELSLLSQEPCCSPSENSGFVLDFKCCSLEQFDTTLDYETLVEQSKVITLDMTPVLWAAVEPVGFVALNNPQPPVLRPPPRANHDVLAFIQVYRL
jgi:hypothetical protein